MNTRSRRIARIPKHNTSTKITNIGYTVLKKQGNTFYRCDKCKVKFNTIPAVKSHFRSCNKTSNVIIGRNCNSTTKLTKNSTPSDVTIYSISEIKEKNSTTSLEESQSDARDDDDENNIRTEVNDEDDDNLYMKIEKGDSSDIEALNEEIFMETLDIHLKAEFTCKHCKEDFNSKGELSEHLKIHSKIFQCGVCDRIFSTSQTLNHHLSVQHSQEKQNRTKKRMDSNKTEQLYKKHEKKCQIKSEPRQYYQCDICAKRYSKYGQIVRHLSIHGDNHPFKCKICLKILTCSKFLKAHMRLHTGETPYQCEVCSKLFSFKHHLVKHMLKHDIMKPFQCKICKKAYDNNATFEKHLQTHNYHHQTYYVCHECPTKYDDYFSLLEHRRVHDVQLHICPVCGKKYIKEANLMEHMKTHE